MNLVEMTEYLVKNLVTNKDEVTVKEFPSDDEKSIVIEVLVNEEDIGKLIGRGGKTANAIRTLVQAHAYIMNLGRVKLNIDSI